MKFRNIRFKLGIALLLLLLSGVVGVCSLFSRKKPAITEFSKKDQDLAKKRDSKALADRHTVEPSPSYKAAYRKGLESMPDAVPGTQQEPEMTDEQAGKSDQEYDDEFDDDFFEPSPSHTSDNNAALLPLLSRAMPKGGSSDKSAVPKDRIMYYPHPHANNDAYDPSMREPRAQSAVRPTGAVQQRPNQARGMQGRPRVNRTQRMVDPEHPTHDGPDQNLMPWTLPQDPSIPNVGPSAPADDQEDAIDHDENPAANAADLLTPGVAQVAATTVVRPLTRVAKNELRRSHDEAEVKSKERRVPASEPTIRRQAAADVVEPHQAQKITVQKPPLRVDVVNRSGAEVAQPIRPKKRADIENGIKEPGAATHVKSDKSGKVVELHGEQQRVAVPENKRHEVKQATIEAGTEKQKTARRVKSRGRNVVEWQVPGIEETPKEGHAVVEHGQKVTEPKHIEEPTKLPREIGRDLKREVRETRVSRLPGPEMESPPVEISRRALPEPTSASQSTPQSTSKKARKSNTLNRQALPGVDGPIRIEPLPSRTYVLPGLSQMSAKPVPLSQLSHVHVSTRVRPGWQSLRGFRGFGSMAGSMGLDLAGKGLQAFPASSHQWQLVAKPGAQERQQTMQGKPPAAREPSDPLANRTVATLVPPTTQEAVDNTAEITEKIKQMELPNDELFYVTNIDNMSWRPDIALGQKVYQYLKDIKNAMTYPDQWKKAVEEARNVVQQQPSGVIRTYEDLIKTYGAVGIGGSDSASGSNDSASERSPSRGSMPSLGSSSDEDDEEAGSGDATESDDGEPVTS